MENTQRFYLTDKAEGRVTPIQQRSLRLAKASGPIMLPLIHTRVGRSMTFRAHVCVARMID